ncbi:unnamed protein product [Strongylus vulgaris]|uniref:Uncharacterized protein n=1 Tax=Strongylus vulgaris TaxID=40348 RepID=A0A3P7KDJ5_STRVU|nr:unnamed protein product [Strongylus vulgaris]
MSSLKRLSPIIRPLHKACTSPFSSTSARTVQVVSFDVNDTLIADGEPVDEVYARVASDHGIKVNPAAVAASYPKYWKNLCSSHPCFGFSTFGEFEWWKRIVIGCLQEVYYHVLILILGI